MNESKTQTLIVLGITLAAIVGAVFGVLTSVVISSQFAWLRQPGQTPVKQVDQRIVELIEEESATIGVVEAVTPGVVSIVVKKERGQITPHTQRLFLSPFFSQPEPKLTPQEAKQLIEVSSGTGFFVSADGFVLTNRHVVDDSTATFFVVNNDGTEFPATLIDTDPFLDVAILKVEGQGLSVVTLGDSDQIRIGQTVIAIGNTLSEFRNTVTKGVISGINRRVTAGSAAAADVIEQAIQTDAAINPGNSGGPLINLRGEVIGINTAVSIEGQAIGFAIPINQAKRAIEDVRQFGRIVRPWLGVRYTLVQNEQPGDKPMYDLGALVVAGNQPKQPAVVSGSPAEKVGIKEGDIIIKIGGTAISKEDSLSELISAHRPGDVVELELLRDNVLTKVSVTLAEYDVE